MSFRYIFLLGTSLRLNGPLAERLMHIAHKILNLSSDWLNDTGFPGDVCVAFRLETKMLCWQTSSWKNKAVMFTAVPNAVFSKVCEIFKVCGIESLKYVVQILHSGLLLWQHFHAHKHDTAQNET